MTTDFTVYQELAEVKLKLLQAEQRAANSAKMVAITLDQLAIANQNVIELMDELRRCNSQTY